MNRRLEVASYWLWTIGSVLFIAASLRSGDWISLAASFLYLFGCFGFLASVKRS